MSPKKAKLEPTELNQLETLTNAEDHLRFAAKVIERSTLSEPTRAELRRQIERIRTRCADPNLYLAVIGEFSSGKSTFINALLRDELLKQSPEVTTATATTLRHGDSLRVEARFKGSKRRTVKAQPKHTYDEIREFIHAATSKGRVARDVTEFSITHPAAFLADGIVIIDTPGTNAPDAESINKQHGEIVHRVLENEADAAIVVISAERIGAQTLNQFLNSALRPFIHRCLFVVTKMRDIKPEQQDMVIDYARANLASNLKIDPPEVYPCSAQVVLDNIHGKVPKELLIWTERFVELEDMVKERLRRERVLSIAENVIRLLGRLLEQLEGELQDLEKHHGDRRAAIQSQTIRDLPSFAAEQREQCHKMLEAAISRKGIRGNVSRLAQGHRQNTTYEIYSAIFTAESNKALRDFGQNEVEELLEEDQWLFGQNLQRELEKLQLEVDAIAHNFDTALAAEYRRLEALGARFTKNPTYIRNSGQIQISNVVSSMESVRKALDAEEGGFIVGGALAGAAVGTFILPGIGSLIGGGIGTVFASVFGSLFGPSLDVRKQRYWDELAPVLDEYFEEIEEWAEAELTNYKTKTKSALTKHINRHVNEYRSKIDAMIREQQNEKQQLQRLQKSTRADLAKIRRRRTTLNGQRDSLAAMSGLDN